MKNLNRRDFIRKSAIISTGTILVPVILNSCTSKAVPSDRLMKMEKEAGLACQMGNQGHSGSGIKQLNDWIERGFLGEVSEVHAWTVAGWNNARVKRPEKQRIPRGLDWNLWIGPAAMVPYNKAYCPAEWRGWNEFGSGALGDWACHNMDAPYFALGLGCPEKVEVESTGPSELAFPESAKLTYLFPTSKYNTPVKLTWYQGEVYKPFRPAQLEDGRPLGNNGGGSVIVGSKATVMMSSHASVPVFIPASKHAEMEQMITNQVEPGAWNGHYDNWLKACKGEEKISSSFEYGGSLTETMLFGNIALRTNSGFNIDTGSKEILNNPGASSFVGYPEVRKGWEI